MKVNFITPKLIHFAGRTNIPSLDKLEWIETSGDGSYASSTISEMNTRAYHGLMVDAKTPPVDRTVILHRIDDEILLGDKKLVLSNVAYENTPDGLDKSELAEIKDFSILPSPSWVYNIDKDRTLTKQIVMPHVEKGQSQVVIGYTYNAPMGSKPIDLRIRPFINQRSMHGGDNNVRNWVYSFNEKGFLARAITSKVLEDRTIIFMSWDKTMTDPTITEKTYNNYYYKREAERGLNPKEDGVYQPFELSVQLRPGEIFSFNASNKIISSDPDITNEVQKKQLRLEALLQQSKLPRNETMDILQRAADQFIVNRQSIGGKTVLAGYHWFNDWGRDTMISLPGLTLTTRRFNDAKSILNTFAKYVYNGMLPNNFPESENDKPGYNTIDASMWWFNAVNQYLVEAGKEADLTFTKSQYQSLKKVVKHHIYGRMGAKELIENNNKFAQILGMDNNQEKLPVGDGQRGIGMDKDGLITCDDGQLTWMDAATWNDEEKKSHPFTPRDGKAVEINALWYNGLRIMASLANRFDDPQEAEKYNKLADIVKNSMQKFINPNGGLYDLIETPDNPEYFEGRGKQIRPNQIIAVGLPNCAFDKTVQKSVVDTVEKNLLTPYGLRSLAPNEKNYAPYYPNAASGERDKVYHQGTVWAWQIGPFCDAYLNVHGDTKETRQKVMSFIEPLLKHVRGEVEEHAQSGSCIGGIAEIFDATEPFYSKGTVNQAWSVAEVLRIYAKLQTRS